MVQFGDERIPAFFWRKVIVRGECWEWLGARSTKGYGNSRDWRTDQSRHAHRIAYEVLVGPVPDGLELDHAVCQNRSCCNPLHLEPVTHAENVRRATVGRTHCNAGHPFVGDNVYVYPPGAAQKGVRRCRLCFAEAARVDAERRRLRNAYKPKRSLASTHCRRGHEYTPETVYVYPDSSRQAGVRRCAICMRQDVAARASA